jgi:two-component system, chemotaxis family, protein-glutamate methylesterase/glutaminase
VTTPDEHPPSRDHPAVVAVGASAGGVEALRDLVSHLPADLPASVLVVLHVPPDSPSALPAILRRVSALTVHEAMDGMTLRTGEVVVARPDHHLVVVDGRVLLTRGPRENGHRPAVDVLFRSAARARGSRAMAVVLSGALDDGASGASAVAALGGTVVVQDFDEALYDSMPRAAARAVGDHAVAERASTAVIAERLAGWARTASRSRSPAADRAASGTASPMDREVRMAEMDPYEVHDTDRPGTPSGFGCPDCAGALFQIPDGSLLRYRCRVGHAWSAESLLARQSTALEGALWVALRSLEERAALNTDLSDRADERGHDKAATRFRENVDEAMSAAELVRQLITEIGTTMSGDGEPVPDA